jgi:hypothetical protein
MATVPEPTSETGGTGEPAGSGGTAEPAGPGEKGRKAAAVARAQAAAARAGAGVDSGLTRAQPVLNVASKALGGLGRVVAGLSVVGGVGAVLLVLLGLRAFGWQGLLLGLLGLAPLAGWRVGRRAVRGAGLLGDPHRVLAAAKASGESGRQWLDHMASLGSAAKARQARGVARSAVGAGRSLWKTVGPDIEGADDLKALALWPRTVAMTIAGVVSPVLLLVALVWGLAVALF